MTEEEIVKKLQEHSELKARFEQLISIIENPKDEITLADDAGMRVIGQMWELGREVLQDWANRQSDKVSKRVVEQRAKDLFNKQNIDVVVGALQTSPEKLVTQYVNSTLICGENCCDH